MSKNYVFHLCESVKLDFYKFKPEYKGDSQEICLDTIMIFDHQKIVYDNNKNIICFTTDLENTDKKWSTILVNLKNTQWKKFCSYL